MLCAKPPGSPRPSSLAFSRSLSPTSPSGSGATNRPEAFIRAELDKVALSHTTFTDDALSLIVRSAEGGLRRAKNLCLGSLLEAVRDRTKTVDLKQVNRVLLQPHWRHNEAGLPDGAAS